MFVVKYRVAGFEGDRTSGPYETREIAKSHADDIAGFEGVEYAVVEPAEPAEVVS